MAPPDRRDVILDAAALRFGRHGYRATSLVDVAAEAGVTKQAIYYHFSGKEELLVELHGRIVVDAVRNAEEIIAHEGDPVVALERILEQHVTALLRNADANMTLSRERGGLSPESEKRMRDLESRYERLVRQVYRSGAANGAIRDTDPTMAVGMLLGACNWAHQWFLPRRGMAIGSIAREFTLLLADGYRNR